MFYCEKPYKIAVIDDDEDQTMLFENMIRKDGRFEPLIFHDTDSGFKAIQDMSIKVVITDQVMPEGYGEDLIYKLYDLGIGVQTIIVTGKPSMLTFNKCLGKGARACLVKPVSFAQMSACLEEAYNYLERCNHLYNGLRDRAR